MSRGWSYRGVGVLVSPTADIPSPFRPRQQLAGVVQTCLDQIEPWQGKDYIIAESHFSREKFRAIVVEVTPGARIIWGVHKGHKAQRPQVSPFVDAGHVTTQDFTLELEGTASRPRLVRAYPGTYTPPLPWQASARDVDGGVRECQRFWQTHAYLWNSNIVRPGSAVPRPPDWWRGRRAA